MRRAVILYIDDTSIRLLVTGGKRIKKWGDLPLEPGLVRGAVIINQAEVAARIRQLLESQRVKTKKVVLGFSGLHSMTRPITLPRLPKGMLSEAVMRTARKALPIPLDQLYISWQAIPTHGGKVQVFLAAIPRKTADALVQTLRQAGLEPSHMALKPFALTRGLKEARTIIADVQQTEFDIVIVADGIPHPIRTVSLPNDALSWQEKLPLIIRDIDSTIKFFNANNGEKPLDSSVPIYVSGELANAPEQQRALSEALGGQPIVTSPPPLEVPPQLDLRRHMVTIALAYHKPKNAAWPLAASLDVLPAPYQPKPISLTRIIAAPSTAVVILLVALLVALMQTNSANITSISNQIETISHLTSQKQVERQELTKAIAQLENDIASVNASSNAVNSSLSSLARRQDVVSSDLKLAWNALPSTITLTGVSQASDKLKISGRAPSDATVLSYAQSLESSGRFSEVIIADLKQNSGEVDFVLALKVR